MDTLIALARVKAARGGNTVRFSANSRLVYDTDEPRGELLTVLASGDWVVYPSGLALPIQCVNWLWAIDWDYRQGTAEQCSRFADRWRPDWVEAVPLDRVHGTCVREDYQNGYDMVRSLSFPAWTVRR